MDLERELADMRRKLLDAYYAVPPSDEGYEHAWRYGRLAAAATDVAGALGHTVALEATRRQERLDDALSTLRKIAAGDTDGQLAACDALGISPAEARREMDALAPLREVTA